MKRCPDCGKRMADEFYFCSECGRRLTEALPEKQSARKLAVGIEETPVSALPFAFDGAEYGSIRYAETLCPGVYYIAAKGGRRAGLFAAEYLAVTEDSPAVSPQARAYGAPLPGAPGVLLYEYEYADKGRHIVEYEAHRYLAERRIPLPEGRSLASDRAFGMEVCPEYFGEFPIPAETPWGPTLAHERLWNGLYWLKTEIGWALAAAYPLCSGLWNDTLELGVLMEYDRENGIENTCGYRFFPYEASCLPIYEMLFGEKDAWTEKINQAALQNAVLQFFPDYGSGDGDGGPCFTAEEKIVFTPGAGTDFYLFGQDPD